MPELAEVETPKTAGFVDRGYNYEKRKKRMEKEEEEIRKLEAEQRGEEDTEEQQPEKEASEEKEADTEVKEETLSAEEKSFKKRYGDLRRHMQDKEKEWDEKFKTFERRLEKESIVPPKSDEDIEEWSKEYPDVAGIVETIAAKKAQEMFSKAEARMQEFDKIQTEAERTKAETVIRKSHEDFDDLRASASVVRVIDLFKVDKGLTKTAKKAKAKDAASTVTKRTKTQVDVEDANDVIRESEVARMSNKEFEEHSDEINKAIRSGKFVYDVSGKAR